MKALIVTINDGKNYNFGNKLQNLAVSDVLKRFGIQSETLDFESKFKKRLKYNLKEFLSKLMELTDYKLAKSEERKFYWKYHVKRIKNFKEFERKYLPQHFDTSLTASSDYDFYVIGSDQVWNPDFFKYHKMKQYAYLLSFCEDSKKICFSPSFGISEIPNEWKPWFKKYLSLIPRISVREEQGVKIVRELTGKEADVIIDPTLMLSADEWRSYSKKPEYIDFSKKYLLTYFLGDLSDDKKMYIEELAKSRNLKVLNLLDKNQKELYTTGVSEFIYLIANAEIITTDSFHASVFSFIFNKPFIVFDRKSKCLDMSSRIDTLLSKFELTDRKSDNINENNVFNADYKKGYEILKFEREKANRYLSEVMHINAK